MTWNEHLILYITMMAPLTGIFVFIYRELKEWRREFKEDIARICLENRVERDRLDAKTDAQLQRIDTLYVMFIDLLKEKKHKKG